MSRCPNCGQKSIVWWKMAFVSPLSPFPCQHCDTELKPRWLDYLLAVLPGSVVFMVFYFASDESSFEQYSGFVAGVLFMALCQMFLMPLSPVQSKDKNLSADAGDG